LEPRASYGRYEIDSVAAGVLTLAAGASFASADVASLASGAEALVVMAATVGGDLETAAAAYDASGEMFKMAVADAAGSVELMAALHRHVRGEGERAGEVVTKRISPGYGDFELASQPVVLKLAGGADLGIRLTENFMMVPRKSVTAIAAVRKI
jgi:cobalamin-dependent methionine synthase I